MLLLVPRHAHLGALLLLPVIASINVINIALDFGLTTVITALMLLATVYLCCWDYDRFRSLFTTRPFEARHGIPTLELDPWERAGFTVFAIALLAFFVRSGSEMFRRRTIWFLHRLSIHKRCVHRAPRGLDAESAVDKLSPPMLNFKHC